MADPFQPKFVDLVRNSTTSAGTGNFILAAAPAGFRSFTSALQPGDSFYYSAVGSGSSPEIEVGRGTLQSDGSIAREAIGGPLTNFSPGAKTVSLIAAAEWYSAIEAERGAGGEPSDGDRGDINVANGAWTIDETVLSPFGRTLIGDASAEDARTTLQLGSASTAETSDFLPSTFVQSGTGAFPRQSIAKIREGWVSIVDFGGVADCTAPGVGTVNNAAYNAAKAALGGNGVLFIPRGKWRFNAPLIHTEGIILQGEGFHSNPGRVAGVSYTSFSIWDGTVLVFDAEVAGLKFLEFCGDADAQAVVDDLALNGINSACYAYKSSRNSVVRDLMLYGGGGTGTTAHGIDNRTVLMVENVYVTNFAGSGLLTQASTSGAGRKYGNASGSRYVNVHSRANKMHGFYTRGIDANVIKFDACDSANNGGAGFLEDSFLGNAYEACHCATNNRTFGSPSGYSAAQRAQVEADAPLLVDQYTGSFIETATFAVNAMHVFIGCYTEGGTGSKAQLLAPSRIEGGLLASSGSLTTASTAVFTNPGTSANSFSNLTRVVPQGGTFSVDGAFRITRPASNNASIDMTPGTGALYSTLDMRGSSGVASGLQILAGQNSAYLSANTIVQRNAAQSTTYSTTDSTGFNINSGALKIGGSVVVDASRNASVATLGVSGTMTLSGMGIVPTLSTNAVIQTGATASRFEGTGANGVAAGAAGVGLELAGNVDGTATIKSYDRTASALAPLSLAGSNIAITGALSGDGAIRTTGGGIGYSPGAGGAVTQASSKSTGVTLNALSGQITMNAASLGANSSVGFTLTNNQVAASDIVMVVIKSGATADSYLLNVDSVAAGSCRISLRNVTNNNRSEALVLSFAILKAVNT